MDAKKTVSVVFVFLLISCIPALARENGTGAYANDKGVEDSSITYENFPVYKVMEAREAYVVVYNPSGTRMTNCVIPKKWQKGTVDDPRKLEIRAMQKNLKPYMTYVKKDGAFYKVLLTLPLSKLDSVWGVVDDSYKLNDADLSKDTLVLD
ncbi:MAG: hypothetical protein LKF96_07730 [Treponema sp.]|jgi:hypothetical protein|nr:hypothetical protein [Treponema sp.]